MFSEGSRPSAVAQLDRQMVHVATEHERDWQSSGGIPGWSPSRLKSEAFLAAVSLAPTTASTRGHQGATLKLPSIKLVTRYKRGWLWGGGWGSDLIFISAHEGVQRPRLSRCWASGLALNGPGYSC